ncbi:MAG TPA: hypothetical protein P5137_11180, partial [Candidatus Brocadiia bacterium]|nr:hypothetical protein [Candidatus Brocadiia bacterium]
RLDPAAQQAIRDRHLRALRWEEVDRPPVTLNYPYPHDRDVRPFPYRQAFRDPAKMLFNELVYAFGASIFLHAEVGGDLPYTVRANCGTVIVASMFGARVEQVDDNPPWAIPHDALAPVEAALDLDPLDLSRGICPSVAAFYEFYRHAMRDYPNLRRCVRVVLPDLQGPLDTAELLRGSEIYTDMCERPEFVTKLLAHLAKAQVAVARRLKAVTTDDAPDHAHQHAAVILGHILLRCDSAINLSAAMYADMVAPHDAWVLREMGGGGIHFCGRGQHVAAAMLRLPDLQCLDLGQPLLNDTDAIYAQARERRVPIVRMRVPEEELVSGRAWRRFPTGVSLAHQVESIEKAALLAKRLGIA